MGRAVIWRDKHDHNMFSIGTVSWHDVTYEAARIHIDYINDLFGDEAYHKVTETTSDGKPVEVALTLAFGNAESKLLIAAPDLLAACKAALFPAGDTPQQVRDQLLAAIRKAEGTRPATEAGR